MLRKHKRSLTVSRCFPEVLRWRLVAALLLLVTLLPTAAMAQNTAEERCTRGVELAFTSSNPVEALPLLEQGLRERDQIRNRDTLAMCTFSLGLLWTVSGRPNEGIELLASALRESEQASDQVRFTVLYGVHAPLFQIGQQAQSVGYLREAISFAEAKAMYAEAATARITLAKLLIDGRQNLDEARSLLERARELYLEHGKPVEAASTLVELGKLDQIEGKFEQAVSRFQEARTVLAAQTDQPLALAKLDLELGTLNARQGRFEEAVTQLKAAQTAFQQQAQPVYEFATAVVLEGVFHTLGQVESLEQTFERAKAIFPTLPEQNQTQSEHLLRSMEASLLNLRGDLKGAAAAYDTALSAINATTPAEVVISLLLRRGEVGLDQGRVQEAITFFSRALDEANTRGLRFEQANARFYLGVAYRQLGRLDAAVTEFDGVLRLYREGNEAGLSSSREARQTYASAFAALSTTLVRAAGPRDGGNPNRERQLAQAHATYREARQLYEQIGIDRLSPGALERLEQVYGEILLAEGRYEDAFARAESAVAVLRTRGEPRELAEGLNGLGLANDYLGRREAALDAYEEALQLLNDLDTPAEKLPILLNLGETYESLGRRAEALEAYTRAFDLLDLVRPLAGSEANRAGIVEQYASYYERAAFLAYDQGDRALAFNLAERGRARAFLDSISVGGVQLADTPVDELIAQEGEALIAREHTLASLTQARLESPDNEALIAELERQYEADEAVYRAVVARIEAAGGAPCERVPSGCGTMTLEDVQQHLPANAAMLAYLVGAERTLIFIITPATSEVVAVPVSRDELERLGVDLRSFSGDGSVSQRAATRLYDLLIEPAADYIGGVNQLIIVPHRSLHLAPFAALRQSDRYLVDEKAITTLPSASTLRYLRAQSPLDDVINALVLGNPDGTLPAAKAEAEAVAKLFGSTALLLEAATKTALTERVNQANLIHIAAHGVFAPQSPLASYLRLAPQATNDGARAVSRSAPGDEALQTDLTVRDIYGLDLRQVRLVVLSACETSVGVISEGDEVVGLSRAFFTAGAPALVTSLWRVDDAATELLMSTFYRELQGGVAPAEALREAQQHVREHRDANNRRPYASPYYWAAFVLAGDGQTLLVEVGWWQRSGWVWAGAGVSALALLLGTVFVLRHGQGRARVA